MSSDPVIEVAGLSKCYEIYDKPQHRLLQMLHRGKRTYYREFWALRDISLQIYKGETVGIIGRNGSGKSTLLQLICGTLHPTAGNIVTVGRIAAILELGAGFNPEFTGRENVYMQGSVLGLNGPIIDQKFRIIEEFAEIGQFIDQPVRTYSSGMMIRLAFAISVNVEPEILIVDEALAVGDERFQRKCFSKIEEIRNSGATILFVSHSGETIVQLCNRAILLDQGEQIAADTPKAIYAGYQRLLYAPEDQQQKVRLEMINHFKQGGSYEGLTQDSNSSDSIEHIPNSEEGKEVVDYPDFYDPNLQPKSTIAYETQGGRIHSPKIVSSDGRQVNYLVRGNRYRYCYLVDFDQDLTNIRFGMLIKTKSGMELGGATTHSLNRPGIDVNKGTRMEVCFDFLCALNPGTYFLNAGVLGDIKGVMSSIHRQLDFAMFKVIPEQTSTNTSLVDFQCKAEYSLRSCIDQTLQ